MRPVWLVAVCLLASACELQTEPQPILQLPEPVSNNAVALVNDTALSFAGLLSGKTWEDVTHRAFACDLAARTCREIAGLPDGIGRLASVAVSVGEQALIFGGYTVAKDGTEVSTPEVWQFDLQSETYTKKAPIPVPVDDAVALVYQGRYVYLVSGWHDHDNVDLVQVYDAHENIWFDAIPFPGDPVFGHAGGIVGQVMLVCDGVKVVPPKDAGKRRTFEGSPACWRGDIDEQDPSKIKWSLAGVLPPAQYRMASAGAKGMIWFAGGSDNPYNYNGIGYDKVPSTPAHHFWKYDPQTSEFSVLHDKLAASMDHRGMLFWKNRFVILGGMGEEQLVLDHVQIVSLNR